MSRVFGCNIKWMLSIIFIGIAIYASGQTKKIVEDQNNPILLSFENMICDLGTFAENAGPKECIFKYKNTKNVPISIELINPSCSCLEVEYSKKTIPPGGTGQIKVIYTNDMGALELNKSLTLYLSTTVKTTRLRVIGVVTEPKTDKE